MSPRSLPCRPSSRASRLLGGVRVVALLSAVAGPLAAAEADRSAGVDATCAWGRLADGHGKLVRCLTQEEAARLRDAPAAAAPVRPATDSPKAAPPPEATRAPAPAAPSASVASSPAPAGLRAPALAAPAPQWPLPTEPRRSAADPGVPTEPAAPALDGTLGAEVTSVNADEGALPDAPKNLKKALERFAECAEKNGGLAAERGEVELRFLLQGRGRAEGVSIKKKRGLGDAAAKCIADVLDRRYVAYPEAPAVGATLVVTVTKKKK